MMISISAYISTTPRDRPTICSNFLWYVMRGMLYQGFAVHQFNFPFSQNSLTNYSRCLVFVWCLKGLPLLHYCVIYLYYSDKITDDVVLV